MVDSCRRCAQYRSGKEQYCDSFPTLTYNSEDKHLGGVTYGRYSDSIVVDESLVLQVPNKSDLPCTAPLLCAGITTYSPLRHWKIGKGHRVGVVWLRGLGHLSLKFASAFGAHVVLFTTSQNKTADALRLGANEVVVSKNEAEMQTHLKSFDFILDTFPPSINLNEHLDLLKPDGTLTLLGARERPLSLNFSRNAVSSPGR